MINFILATAMCQGCSLLDNMDNAPESEVVICMHQDVPEQSGWKCVGLDGDPDDGESCIILYKGHYVHALWSGSLSMWYTPFFTEKKFLEESEVKYYSVVSTIERIQ